MKPWALGPYQLIQHADGHFKEGKDIDRKIAIVGFDNAIELCIDVFVNLHPRFRNNYQIKKEDIHKILQNYHTKMDFLDTYLKGKNESIGISVDEIIWYHTLRNELYHSGNGMIPELFTVQNIREGAIKIFEYLFNEKYEEDIESIENETEKPSIGNSDKMIFLSQWINFESKVRELHNLLAKGLEPSRKSLNYIWDELSKQMSFPTEHIQNFNLLTKIRNAIVHSEDISEKEIGANLEKLDKLEDFIESNSTMIKTKIVVSKILPILVKQAKDKEKITYGELALQSGLSHHRPIPRALGFIRDKICIPNKFPALNAIVVSQKVGMPGEAYLSDKSGYDEDFSESELWNKKLEEVWNYTDWDNILKINIFNL
jgi:hypothetical protein